MKWQPIKTAPKDGTSILLSDGEAIHTGHWGRGLSSSWWMAWHGYHTPTHWMPLPEPPK